MTAAVTWSYDLKSAVKNLVQGKESNVALSAKEQQALNGVDVKKGDVSVQYYWN